MTGKDLLNMVSRFIKYSDMDDAEVKIENNKIKLIYYPKKDDESEIWINELDLLTGDIVLYDVNVKKVTEEQINERLNNVNE